MSRFITLAGPFLALVLSACTPQYVERVASATEALPERTALFPGAPTQLRSSFRAACTDPGDQYLRRSGGIRQCRSLPTPELAAFLLVQYDGALEVPKLIIQTEERGTGAPVEVGFSYFAEVTQKSGSVQRVYFRDRELDGFIDRLLVATGGTLPG